MPVVWSPSVIKLLRVVAPVPPEVTARAEARVRAPALEKLDVAVEPNPQLPRQDRAVVEAFANVAVPENVGDAENTKLPEPVSSVISPAIPAEVVRAVKAEAPLPLRIPVKVEAPVPPSVTARSVASVRTPAFENDEVAVPPKYAGPYEERRVVDACWKIAVLWATMPLPIKLCVPSTSMSQTCSAGRRLISITRSYTGLPFAPFVAII